VEIQALFVPIIQFLISIMMEMKNLNRGKFDETALKHHFFEDVYDNLTFLKTLKNYIDIDEGPLDHYKFG
jgi:hypothetical protein